MTTASTFTDLGDGRTGVVIHQTNMPAMYRPRKRRPVSTAASIGSRPTW